MKHALLRSRRPPGGAGQTQQSGPARRTVRLTEAEAKDYESRYQLDRTVAISRNTSFELDAAGDLDTYEPGPLLPGRRTSMINDLADGTVPPLTPESMTLPRSRAPGQRTAR